MEQIGVGNHNNNGISNKTFILSHIIKVLYDYDYIIRLVAIKSIIITIGSTPTLLIIVIVSTITYIPIKCDRIISTTIITIAPIAFIKLTIIINIRANPNNRILENHRIAIIVNHRRLVWW